MSTMGSRMGQIILVLATLVLVAIGGFRGRSITTLDMVLLALLVGILVVIMVIGRPVGWRWLGRLAARLPRRQGPPNHLARGLWSLTIFGLLVAALAWAVLGPFLVDIITLVIGSMFTALFGVGSAVSFRTWMRERRGA